MLVQAPYALPPYSHVGKVCAPLAGSTDSHGALPFEGAETGQIGGIPASGAASVPIVAPLLASGRGTQVPFWQLGADARHWIAHPPQLFGSVCSFTQTGNGRKEKELSQTPIPLGQ